MELTQTGEVVGQEPGQLVVRLPQPCAEAHCNSCGLCAGQGTEQALILQVETDEAVATGEFVRLLVTVPNQAVVAVVVFGLPLVGAVIGGLLGHWAELWRDDIGVVVFGGAGLVTGFAVVALINRLVPALRARARFLGRVKAGAQA